MNFRQSVLGTSDNPVSSPLSGLFLRLRRRDHVSADEEIALIDAVDRELVVEAGQDIFREGDRPAHCLLLLDGLAARYRTLDDGARQISAFHVAGDFVDLPSLTLKMLDHSMTAVSTCRFAVFKHSTLRHISEDRPHLTRLLWMVTLLDSSIQREWLVGMGRRTALQRTAHLFCEIGARLEIAGRGTASDFHFPATQNDIADALGLSLVHANRTIKSLKDMGLVSRRRDAVRIADLEKLRRLARFTPGYLHLEFEPR